MATEALPAPRTARRRAFFGYFDADGWWWAGVKAFAWFIFIIIFLGYIPDRAYYFTVNRTIDLGIMFWSPVNLCPAENRGLPCPAPVGAIVPWTAAPAELNLAVVLAAEQWSRDLARTLVEDLSVSRRPNG